MSTFTPINKNFTTLCTCLLLGTIINDAQAEVYEKRASIFKENRKSNIRVSPADTSGVYYYDFRRRVTLAYSQFSEEASIKLITLCQGSDLLLQAPGNAEGVDYLWTGPDGFTFSGKELAFTNLKTNSSGVYRVSIHGRNITEVGVIRLEVFPVPDIRVQVPTFRTGELIHLSSFGDESKLKYRWENEKGEVISRNFDVFISPQQSGEYNLVFRAENEVCKMSIPIKYKVLNANKYSDHKELSEMILQSK